MSRSLPSRERLKELKSEGVFAWSGFATRSAIAATVVGAVFLSRAWLGALTREFNGADVVGTFEVLGRSVLQVVLLTAVGTLVMGLLFSLAQTRGAFGVSVSRAVRKRRLVPNPAKLVLSVALVGVVAAGLVYVVAPSLLALVGVTNNAVVLNNQIEGVFGQICKVLVVASLVLAILLLFVARIAFLFSQSGEKGRAGAYGQQ